MIGLASQVQEGHAVHPPQIDQAVVAKLGKALLDLRDLLVQQPVIVIVIETSRLADGYPTVRGAQACTKSPSLSFPPAVRLDP